MMAAAHGGREKKRMKGVRITERSSEKKIMIFNANSLLNSWCTYMPQSAFSHQAIGRGKKQPKHPPFGYVIGPSILQADNASI